VVARAVVVQSRPELARALCEALAAHSIEALVAADAADAARMVDTIEPDVVLLDLTLPPLDGWCVLAALGRTPPGADRRPEIIVRVADHRQAERALRLGADAWAADDAQVVAAAGRLIPSIAA